MHLHIVNFTQLKLSLTPSIDYCTIFYFFLQICLDISENMIIIIFVEDILQGELKF